MKNHIICFVAILSMMFTGCTETQPAPKKMNAPNTIHTTVSTEKLPEIETVPTLERIPSDSSHGVYVIQYKFTLQSNHSVGNDWKKSVTVNGRERKSGDTVTGKANDCITLHCTVWEEDSVPDIGNTTVNIRLADGATGTVRITVRENRGRFKGNTAVWEFSYSVTLP